MQDIMEQAIHRQSSDVYFLPNGDEYAINFSIDGCDVHYQNINSKIAMECINYLKFQAHMNISEHRRPQLGAWYYQSTDQRVSCRLSSVGDFRGRESLVVRLIYEMRQLPSQRYFFQNQWNKVKDYCRQRGLMVFSGPTGSGKTTSMYQLTRHFTDHQILSIEDPIEIFYPDILQLQVNDKAGMSYQELIKVALRHHPDILIIGEIRDYDTAKIAVQAALSGHLVMTTVHAANCWGVVSRLHNLGVSLTDLEQTLQLVNYQRLIPTIQGKNKVLFDQLDFRSHKLSMDVNHYGMTSQWDRHLQEILRRGKITLQSYERYLYG